jgi:hypothetical protein
MARYQAKFLVHDCLYLGRWPYRYRGSICRSLRCLRSAHCALNYHQSLINALQSQYPCNFCFMTSWCNPWHTALPVAIFYWKCLITCPMRHLSFPPHTQSSYLPLVHRPWWALDNLVGSDSIICHRLHVSIGVNSSFWIHPHSTDLQIAITKHDKI